jgi:hypothetical protein
MSLSTRAIIFLIVTVFVYSGQSIAGDLRGQIVGESYRKNLVPRQGVKVQLVRARDHKLIKQVISGVNGTIYFYSIQPGEYYLKVNGKSKPRFTVRGDEFQDLGRYRK